MVQGELQPVGRSDCQILGTTGEEVSGYRDFAQAQTQVLAAQDAPRAQFLGQPALIRTSMSSAACN